MTKLDETNELIQWHSSIYSVPGYLKTQIVPFQIICQSCREGFIFYAYCYGNWLVPIYLVYCQNKLIDVFRQPCFLASTYLYLGQEDVKTLC